MSDETRRIRGLCYNKEHIRRHTGQRLLKLERKHNHNRRSRSHEQSPIPSCHCRIQPGIELFLQVGGYLSVEPSDLALEYHWGWRGPSKLVQTGVIRERRSLDTSQP
jgi:hypothetical protein